MHSDSNHIIKTISWGVLWRVLRYPFLLFSLLVIPRMMGDVVYGRFAVFLAVYMMSESFTGLGNLHIFGRFLPEHGDNEYERSSHFLHGMLFYGIIATLLVASIASIIVLSFQIEDFSMDWILILFLVLILGKVQGTLFSFLYGRNQIGRFSFSALVRSIARFVFVVGLYQFAGLNGAIWAFVLNELLLACLAAFWAREYLFSNWRFPKFSEFLPYLKFGLSFYVPIFLLGLLQRSGNVLITGLSRGEDEYIYSQVSHFDLANQFLLLTVSFFAIFLVTLVPSLTKMHITDQHERIQLWLARVLTYCGMLGLVAVNTLAFFGRDLISYLGDGFAGTYDNAMIMSIAIFPLIVVHVGTNVAVVEKEPRINIGATAAGLVFMLILFFVLVPRYGAVGASWSSVGGYLLYSAVFIHHYRELFRRTLGRMSIVVLVGLLSVPIYLQSPRLPAGALYFAALSSVQLCLLWVLRVFSLSDFKNLVGALGNPSASNSRDGE